MIDYKNTIKVIGFDLDQTLYPKSPDIDTAIHKYIYQKIAEVKKCTEEEAQKLFSDLYKGGSGLSGRKTLVALEIPNAADIIQEALERADIAATLKPNKHVVTILERLKKQYNTLDLITGADWNDTIKKIAALSIPENIFAHIITAEVASKSDGSAYRYWMNLYENLNPETFLYVGDRPSIDHEIPCALGIKTMLVWVEEKDPTLDVLQLSSLLGIEKYLL